MVGSVREVRAFEFKANIADNPISPQSSYSNEGDSARVDWLSANNVTMFGNLTLPYGIELPTQFDRSSGHPYDITIGTDNNGDGNFNDRPSYTSSSASGSGIYSTQFGLLTSNTVHGNVPRNLGTMPATMHLDTDLSRAFILNPKDKDHPRTLTFNARSANLINHTNVTAVNTVLSSGIIGQPLTAEAARRIELGVRFSFLGDHDWLLEGISFLNGASFSFQHAECDNEPDCTGE